MPAVTTDTERLDYNTAISAMMEFTNHLTRQTVRPRSALKTFVLLLAPFAPHLAEELWSILNPSRRGMSAANPAGELPTTLAYEPWPTFDEHLLKSDTIDVPVQINGKVRSVITVAADIDPAALEKAALSDEKIRGQLEGKTIRKVIVVPAKLVNIVIA